MKLIRFPTAVFLYNCLNLDRAGSHGRIASSHILSLLELHVGPV